MALCSPWCARDVWIRGIWWKWPNTRRSPIGFSCIIWPRTWNRIYFGICSLIWHANWEEPIWMMHRRYRQPIQHDAAWSMAKSCKQRAPMGKRASTRLTAKSFENQSTMKLSVWNAFGLFCFIVELCIVYEMTHTATHTRRKKTLKIQWNDKTKKYLMFFYFCSFGFFFFWFIFIWLMQICQRKLKKKNEEDNFETRYTFNEFVNRTRRMQHII